MPANDGIVARSPGGELRRTAASPLCGDSLGRPAAHARPSTNVHCLSALSDRQAADMTAWRRDRGTAVDRPNVRGPRTLSTSASLTHTRHPRRPRGDPSSRTAAGVEPSTARARCRTGSHRPQWACRAPAGCRYAEATNSRRTTAALDSPRFVHPNHPSQELSHATRDAGTKHHVDATAMSQAKVGKV
jgi:hypothetical protein